MKNFENIRLICEGNSSISARVLDEFLHYFAAGRNNLGQEMEHKFLKYRHVTQKLKQEWTNRLKSQYIIHRVFKKDGLIKSFLNHPALKKLDKTEMEYLEFQAEHVWRFSFSVIKNSPAASFFVMEDVFSNEEFLLYSPGVKITLEDQTPILWFNLISYNGSCWQSFGPIGAYNSFEPDDIFFFATEINPDIADEQDLLINIENNPLPYMMLLSGANSPMVFNKKDQLVQVVAEYEVDPFNTKKLTKGFVTEYNKGVYRLALKRWSESPHFAQAYFDEHKKTILLTAMTDRGFTALADGLKEYGYDFPADPSIRVSLAMVITASDILNKKIRLNEYEGLFVKETSAPVKKDLDKLNVFLGLAIPVINSGKEPDVKALAEKAGVDFKSAQALMKQIRGKLNDMG